jgi:ribonuclease P protein component
MTKASRMISEKEAGVPRRRGERKEMGRAFFHSSIIAPRVARKAGRLLWRSDSPLAKKMIGIAVKRNRAKRRLSALAREFLIHHAQSGHNFVLIAREASLSCDMKDMCQHVERL